MSTRRIVACGGGNPTTSSRPLFEAGLDLTGANKPKLLYVPTAVTTEAEHDMALGTMTVYAASRGIQMHVLHNFGQLPTLAETAELLHWADAMYVEMGDTRRAFQQWVDAGMCELLRDAVDEGELVAIGIGAGFMPWWISGFSDANSFTVAPGAPWKYTEIDCLGNLNAIGCPHHDGKHPLTDELRRLLFQRFLRHKPVGTIGVGADENVAIRIAGDRVTALGNGGPGLLHRIEVVGERQSVAHALMPNDDVSLAEFFSQAA